MDYCVYVTFLDDHGKEFIAETQSRSSSEIPFEFDEGTTYEIIYYSKSDDEDPVRYTDIVKIKLAEYDLNIIDEKNDKMIHLGLYGVISHLFILFDRKSICDAVIALCMQKCFMQSIILIKKRAYALFNYADFTTFLKLLFDAAIPVFSINFWKNAFSFLSSSVRLQSP